MNVQILHSQEAKLKLLEQAFEKNELPPGSLVWIGDPDRFNCVFIECTISTKVIGVNVTIDLLHESVCLATFRTRSDIDQKVKSLLAKIWENYNAFFPNHPPLPIAANPGISNKNNEEVI